MNPKIILALLTELHDPAFKGGIQVYNQSLIKALNVLGFSYSTVILNDGRRKEMTYVFRILLQFSYVFRVFFAVYRSRPDIIINGHVGFSPVCFLVKKIFGIPYITITYGVDVRCLSGIKKIGLKNSAFILSISNYTRSLIVDQLKEYPLNQIILLPNAVNGDKFKPNIKPRYLLRKFGFEEMDMIVLSICRLSKSEKDKGYDKIIVIIEDLLLRFPNLKYILGGSGDDLPRLHELVKEKQLEGVVVLPGFIPEDELSDYYNLCDLFVLPSKKEGFGFVFLEALACGKPVIAGNKDGSVDAVLSGEIGLLVDPDSISEIRDAVAKILTKNIDKKLLNKDYLRTRVLQEYDFARFKSRLATILS